MMRKPAVVSTLEEDFKRIGLTPPAAPAASEISEGKKMPAKKPAKVKGKKVLEKKGAKPKRGEPLVKAPKGKKKGLKESAKSKLASLMEGVRDVLIDLRAEESVDIVKGFEHVSAVYKSLSKRFAHLAESFSYGDFAALSKELAKRSEKTARSAYEIANHLAEGRGPQLNYDLVESNYRSHVATVLESLELFGEAEKLMGLGGEDQDDEDDDLPHVEPDGDEAPEASDEGDGDDSEDEESDEAADPGDEDSDDEPASDDDAADDAEGGDEDDSDDSAEEEPAGDSDADDAGQAGDDDDDFLAHLKNKGGEEEDESVDMGAEEEVSDEEGDEPESDDSDDSADSDDVDGDDNEDEDDQEEVEENVVDTTDDSSKWLGKRVPQSDEDDESPTGKIATDNDAGHGGSSKNTYPKGKGVMKGGPMESKGSRGKGW